MMAEGQDRGEHYYFVKSHLTTLASIFNNDELIKSLCYEKGIITLDEYNALPLNWTTTLLMKPLNKGEETCQKFVSEVLKNPKVEETFPRLQGLNWSLLDSEPERTSMPGQGPRLEWRDISPASSPMEIDVTTPQSMSQGYCD